MSTAAWRWGGAHKSGSGCPRVPVGQADRLSWCCAHRDIGKRLEVRKTVTACLGEASHIMRLEHVQARLTLSYNRRGDLAIHLVSPMGTRSTLLAARCLPGPLRRPPSTLSQCMCVCVCARHFLHPVGPDGHRTLSVGRCGHFLRDAFILWGCPVLQESPIPPLRCHHICVPSMCSALACFQSLPVKNIWPVGNESQQASPAQWRGWCCRGRVHGGLAASWLGSPEASEGCVLPVPSGRTTTLRMGLMTGPS